MQHFILEGKDGVWDGTEISQRVYCGREDGVMGSLEARGVAKGDRAGFWQAVIVDLFSGSSAWWDSSRGAASLQVGIDACGTRGDFQRCYGPSIGPVDRKAGRARYRRSRPQYAALAPRSGRKVRSPRARFDRLEQALTT